VVFEYAAGPDKKLYGSVTAKDISEELKKKHGIDIDKRKITLAEPIKSFGEFKADVKLYTEISGKINVFVTSKKQ
ncbi:MAG: 50S ribosomal protein L9, partial [Clostridia bacterium]|nr:50S ribosomal protein L9 [Clostridia bacterium]